jgi:hypothetical protein
MQPEPFGGDSRRQQSVVTVEMRGQPLGERGEISLTGLVEDRGEDHRYGLSASARSARLSE